MAYNLVDGHQPFGAICCFHLHGRNFLHWRWRK